VASSELYLEISIDHPVPPPDEGPDSQCSVSLRITSDDLNAKVLAADIDDDSVLGDERELWLTEDYSTVRALIGEVLGSGFVCLVDPAESRGPHGRPQTRVERLAEFDDAVAALRAEWPAAALRNGWKVDGVLLRIWAVPSATELDATVTLAQYRTDGGTEAWHEVRAAGIVHIDFLFQYADLFVRCRDLDRVRGWVTTAVSGSARRVVWQ
jgi:hypothetical protein